MIKEVEKNFETIEDAARFYDFINSHYKIIYENQYPYLDFETNWTMYKVTLRYDDEEPPTIQTYTTYLNGFASDIVKQINNLHESYHVIDTQYIYKGQGNYDCFVTYETKE